MKHVYIINQESRATFYGIGTYTQQLVSAIQLLCYRITVVTLSYKYQWIEVKEIEDVRYITIPMPSMERYTRFFSEKEDKRYLRNVYYMLIPYVCQKEKLIFHFNFQELGELACLLKENFSCKIVTTMHYTHWGFNLLGSREKLYDILKNNNLNKSEENTRDLFLMEQSFYRDIADYVIAISQHMYDDLLFLYGVPSSKVFLILNGLRDEYQEINDKEKRELKRTFCFNLNTKLILFVGRVTPVKGVDFLIKAFRMILEIRQDVHLLIIGEGSEDDLKIYQEQIYPYYSKISFTGFMSKEKLQSLYQISDIGIIPSLYEPFGYVALEMLMHNLPIVVNKSTGLKEIVQDGINGSSFCIKANDEKSSAEDLCIKIVDLLTNPQKRTQYTKNGRSIFLQKYELEVFSHSIKNFYSKISH